MPLHLIIFTMLCGYIVLHGIITSNLYTTHYYWIGGSIFLLSFIWINVSLNQDNRKKFHKTLYEIVSIIALLEALLVLLQIAGILPSANKNFSGTGTWTNPNVTAHFLVISLFAFINLLSIATDQNKRIAVLVGGALILLAILLLKSRSAYFGLIIISVGSYHKELLVYFKTNLRFNFKGLLLTAVSIYLFVMMVALFKEKRGSSEARLRIWNNSTELISLKPLWGIGFGSFEKEYNLYAATKQHPQNTYVRMAYNDFLELGVEGGIIPVFLWGSFLVALILYCVNPGNGAKRWIPLVVAFGVMQSVNFLFQAIPAFILFLIFIGMTPVQIKEYQVNNKGKFLFKVAILLPIMVGCLVMIRQIAGIAHASYKSQRFRHMLPDEQVPSALMTFYPTLKYSALYHEELGDAYIRIKQIDLALLEYRTAMKFTSKPSVLTKAGDCLLEKKDYSNSEQYYMLVQKLVPEQLGPKMSLLRLYDRKGDSTRAIFYARKILETRPKITTPKIAQMKAYAADFLDSQTNVIKDHEK